MDQTLVERAIQGDEDAYVGLMAIAGDRLLAIAYRILRDLHRAEDAVEATLVNAWRDLPTLRDADRFEAWLTRILVRECYLEADRGRRLNAHLRALPIDIAGTSDPTSTVVDRDRLDRGSGVCRPTSGRSSCSITTWDGVSPRSPSHSRFPSGP
jgi:RNA polymerase sigma-70 factor (ECF subfamily)